MKPIIAIIIVVAVIAGAGAWYWYAGTMLSGKQYSGMSPEKSNNTGAPQEAAGDTTARISSDLNSVPDDSSVEDSVKLIDSSVSTF